MESSRLAADPQITDDGKRIGWLAGEHQIPKNWSLSENFLVYPALVVLTTDGKRTKIEPEPGWEVCWMFWNSGEQVAIMSRGHHGPVYFKLYNSSTGKLDVAAQAYVDGEEQVLPDWARALREHNKDQVSDTVD